MQTAPAMGNPSEQPVEEIFDKEGGIFFNASEWKYFQLEIEDMIKSDREFNFLRAVRNARYLAMVDKGIKQMQEGGGRLVTDDELRKMLYE